MSILASKMNGVKKKFINITLRPKNEHTYFTTIEFFP